jgi:FO synthase
MKPVPDRQVVARTTIDSIEARALAFERDTRALMRRAAAIRDDAFSGVLTYSRKVFLPLTHLCRDSCHYCTFARPPRKGEAAYMRIDEVLALARRAQDAGCTEALFTLGDKPELRYPAARRALDDLGFSNTIDFLHEAAGRVLAETTLLPHLNPGVMTRADLANLRPVSASMGLMLETTSERLAQRGMPHFGSPDKAPAARIATMRAAGSLAIPFTTGLLIGIGETRAETIEALLAIRGLDDADGHIQEIIIQPFRAKTGTRMSSHADASADDLLWAIAVARIILGSHISVQTPPNLSPDLIGDVINAGVDDWGGISPITLDHVNPEAPWPHIDTLAKHVREAGRVLVQRLPLYPRYLREVERWTAPGIHTAILRASDSEGFAREGDWSPGKIKAAPKVATTSTVPTFGAALLDRVLAKADRGEELAEDEIVRLFAARDDDFSSVTSAADTMRRRMSGDTVRYVVNRNINYTNVCAYRCQFCAFSKGKASRHLRGPAYDLDAAEIGRRVAEAWTRGATEVCMQGGIHPDYTGDTYLAVLGAVKSAVPGMHVHAFSPLEVQHGAATLGQPIADYLARLRDAGLGSLPGTAAEILDDEIRAVICPDKVSTREWLDIMAAAHGVGLRTTATIMFGHIEGPRHWARHLLAIRRLQAQTGGFTELVPLPFVHMEAPIYFKGRARRGPTWREAILMHAVSRIVLHPVIPNIQVSWVKMGAEGIAACLAAGANDLGGTLMNESISRAAGAAHGQELAPAEMDSTISRLGRRPQQRTTLYGKAPDEQRIKSYEAAPLAEAIQTPAGRHARLTGQTTPRHNGMQVHE